jgi:hypothetical protein
MKVHLVVTQLFYLDGWTGMKKLADAFGNFVTASKKWMNRIRCRGLEKELNIIK